MGKEGEPSSEADSTVSEASSICHQEKTLLNMTPATAPVTDSVIPEHIPNTHTHIQHDTMLSANSSVEIIAWIQKIRSNAILHLGKWHLNM